MGPSLATEIILESRLADTYDLIHLDTSHHKDLSTLGAVGLQNVFWAIRHYAALTRLIIRVKPAVIYIPISQTTIGYVRDSVFIILGKLFNKKIVAHLRGGNFRNWLDGANVLVKYYVRLVHKLVDAQIVLGEKLRYIFAGLIPNEKVFVVPNGCDFDWSIDKGATTEPDKIRVLYLSNFIRAKGILDVLHAIPRVKREYENVEFVLAGAWFDDDVKQEIEATVQTDAGECINLLGTVTGQSKVDALLQADLFVLPTYYPAEGQPWVILEAMATGLPVIATDQGAITESVVDGVNGFIVEKRNSAQLAAKIVRLCQDPRLRKLMGRESRRIYEKKFTEDKMVEKMSKVFDSVLIKNI